MSWKILTISDVHIRSLERHSEYKQVFKQFLEHAEILKPDYIFNLGDLFHNKLQLSPEAVILVRWFYHKLTKIAPVITIVGNHDMNVTNYLRPDSISATISDIKNHTILKSSSFFELTPPVNDKKGIAIGHFSFFESQSEWPKHIPCEFKDHICLALYHGAVNQYETDTGFIEHGLIKYNDWFTEYDMVICGDIHKHQKMSDKCYMIGNLIQQNFGENVDKGYLEWDIKDKKNIRLTRHLLNNDFNYLNVFVPYTDIDKAKDLVNKELSGYYVTKNSNIKLIISTTRVVDVAFKEDLTKFVIEKFSVTPIIEDSFRLNTTQVEDGTSEITKPTDFSDSSYQNELIINYLNNEFNLPKEITIDEICEMNTEINNDLGLSPNYGSKTWSIIDFKFSNMFQYGEDISIDFENDIKGLVGLFGENAAGKSNLFNALSFVIFGSTVSKVALAEIIRDDAKEARGSIIIKRAGKLYKIERNLVRQKDKAKHIVDFSIKEKGSWISLNEETVVKTNQIIAEYFGSFENFRLTTLSSQNNYAKFIQSGNTDKKDVVMSNLGIGVFSKLYDYSKDKLKEINAVIKEYENSDALLTELASYKNQMTSLEDTNIKEQEKSNKVKKIVESIDIRISEEEKRIKPISCLIIDEDKSNKKIELFETELNKLYVIEIKEDIQTVEMSITKTKKQIEEFQTKISEQLKTVYSDIGKAEESIKRHKNITDKFGDINCKQDDCILLQLYKKDCCDIESVNRELKKLKEGEQTLLTKQFELKEELKLHDKLETLQRKALEINSKIEKLNYEMENEQRLIDEYIKNKTVIEDNKTIQSGIDKLKISRSTGFNAISESTATINANKRLIKEYDKRIVETSRKIDRIHEMKRKANVLVIYNNIMNPNALPNNVLKNYINILESEVNRMLGVSTNLKTRFYLDTTEGKKTSELVIEFKNKNSDEWHSISASSGAEEMLLSLAIRVAMINVTTIHKSNLLVVDEGFGALDKDRLGELPNLLKTISKMFHAVIIISHLESMASLPDKIIHVINEQGKSSLIL